MGGDEFTVVLDSLSKPDDAKLVAGRIIKAIEAITSVVGRHVEVSLSVGIALIPAGEPARVVTSDELLRVAGDAMYLAKKSGKGHFRFVDLTADPVGAAA